VAAAVVVVAVAFRLLSSELFLHRRMVLINCGRDGDGDDNDDDG
jgi:hypothetical protein